MLGRAMAPRRELVLYVIAALLPAILVGALGLRALTNEEAALRREAALGVQSAAESAAKRGRDRLGGATLALGKLPADVELDDEAMRLEAKRSVEAIAPPFAEATLLDRSGHVLEPAAPSAKSETPAHQAPLCDAAVRTLDADRENATRTLLASCPDAQDDAGRWLFPVLAAAAIERDRDEAGAEALATKLAAWLETHGDALRAEEREALAKDLERSTSLSDGTKRDVAAKVRESGTTAPRDVADSVVRAANSDRLRRALTDAAAGELVTIRMPGVAAAFVPVANGGWVGFVVTEETLARGLRPERRDAWLALPEGMVAAATTTAPSGELASPEAVAWLDDGLGLRVSLADPTMLARKATQSRRIVGALSIGGAILALGAALFLVRRAQAARRTSELRTTFVAAVSHELRTPLASVRMLSELLAEERVEDDERREVADALVKEAKRMGETVERFMTFARMDRGKLVATKKRVDATAVALGRIEAFRLRHPELSVEAELADAEADLDASLFELTIDNLLENAAKYAPAGAPYVVRLEAPGDLLRLSVEDHGPGVPPGLEKKIWEAFERGDDRLSKATGGTGLGLSLVRGVALAHGGRADFERLENGTRFVVEWPRKAETS